MLPCVRLHACPACSAPAHGQAALPSGRCAPANPPTHPEPTMETSHKGQARGARARLRVHMPPPRVQPNQCLDCCLASTHLAMTALARLTLSVM